MLDGGHVSRALFGMRYHRVISFIAAGVAVLLGYWLFGILIVFFALRGHPGPRNELIPLSRSRKLLSFGLLGILVLCAIPIYQPKISDWSQNPK